MSDSNLSIAVLRAMLLALLADGEGRDDEHQALNACYRGIIGAPPDRARVDAELRFVAADPERTWEFLRASPLDDAAKDVVLKAVIVVCMADAELQEEEIQVLNRLASTLGLPLQRVKAAMSEVWRQSRHAG